MKIDGGCHCYITRLHWINDVSAVPRIEKQPAFTASGAVKILNVGRQGKAGPGPTRFLSSIVIIALATTSSDCCKAGQ